MTGALFQKQKILQAFLDAAAEEGWSALSLRCAAADLGIRKAEVERHFPGGVEEVWGFYREEADRAMREQVEADAAWTEKGISARITALVRGRLERADPHRPALRRAAAWLALPHHAPLAARSLWETADEMWRLAGDQATDWNYYSKRTLLSGVYASTFFYWLEDESEGCADTWAFLDHRIQDVLRVGKSMGQAGKAAEECAGRLLVRLGVG